MVRDANIFIGGIHPEWEADGGVRVRGFAINIANETFREGPYLRISVGIHSCADPRHELSGGLPYAIQGAWVPGQAVEINAISLRTDESRPSQSLWITVHEGKQYPEYHYPCFDADLRIPSGTGGPPDDDGRIYITPDIEERFYPRLLQCCEWLPPKVDPKDVQCAPAPGGLQCTFVAWNWSNKTQSVDGEVVLRSKPKDGPATEYTRTAVSVSSLSPGERRNVTVAVAASDVTMAQASKAGGLQVGAVLWIPGLPKARAESWTPIP